MHIDNSSTIGSIHLDNKKFFPFPWELLPDLEISESKIIWEKNKKSIHCIIKNKGIIDSKQFYIRFYTKQKNKQKKFLMQRSVPQLKANETFTFNFNIMRIAHNYENNLNDVEKFIIKVDYNNKIKESNENNNMETILVNTNHVPTPNFFNLNKFYFDSNRNNKYDGSDEHTKINFKLNNLKVIKTEDDGIPKPWPLSGYWDKEDEPFLWVYGIQIDYDTLLHNKGYVIKSKNYGHRNMPSLKDGKSAKIPHSVGNISFNINPIPIVNFALLGIITIVFDEDRGPSNHAMKVGYRAGAKKINNILKNIGSIQGIHKMINEGKIAIDSKGINYNIDKIVKEISIKVEKEIKKSIKNGAIRFSLTHVIQDTLYAVGAMVDKDDKIGDFNQFRTYKNIKKHINGENFTSDIIGSGAHYRITGSISAQKPKNYYKTYKHQLKYGDIILFSGEAGESDVVKIPTNSKWSHVGIIYKEATDTHDAIILEATPKHGVRIMYLGNKVKHYDGDISIRHLIVKRDESMKTALKNLYRELKGRPYESADFKGLRELANAGIDLFDKDSGHTLNHKNLSKIFCSELVAEAYQRMGLLSISNPLYPSNEFTPKDFSAEKELDLLKGELLRELIVKK
jgi:hypothetical protein